MDKQLGLLPAWYACEPAVVLTTDSLSAQQEKLLEKTGRNVQCIAPGSYRYADGDVFHPWGWDAVALHMIKKRYGVDLKGSIDVEKIRAYSHRGKTVEVLSLMAENGLFERECLPRCVTSAAELKQATGNRPSVLKVPISNSGRGLYWLHGGYEEACLPWAEKTIKTQGCIMVEPLWSNLQDFAMEFECRSGACEFAGYSLFFSKNGVYAGNALLGNEAVERKLEEKGVNIADVRAVRTVLLQYITKHIASFYSGPLGVDMLVGRPCGENDGKVRINPCVEINLRHTMGYVSSKLSGLLGDEGYYFKIIHSRQSGEIKKAVEVNMNGNVFDFLPLTACHEKTVVCAAVARVL